LTDKVEKYAPTLRRFDRDIGLKELLAPVLFSCAMQRSRDAAPFETMEAADEIGDTAGERRGDFHQARKADPVVAGFVFLHLLKRDADEARQGGLAQALVLASQANAPSERNIERMRLTRTLSCNSQTQYSARQYWASAGSKSIRREIGYCYSLTFADNS
jgi:hypothetical protein